MVPSSGSGEFETNSYTSLISTLIKKRPEAKINFQLSNSNAHRFVKRQMALIKKGYTEEKAFQLTENEFRKSFEKQRRSASALHQVAVSNRLRSFMDQYQQLSV